MSSDSTLSSPPVPRSPRVSFAHRLAFWSYLGLESVLRLIPLPVCFGLGLVFGRMIHIFAPSYRRLARRNIRIAFGDSMTEKEIRHLARRHFARLGANLVASIKLALFDHDTALSHLQVDDYSAVQKAVDAGRGILYLIPHLGNWELLARTSAIGPAHVPRAALYRSLANPLIDRHVRTRRESQGTVLLERKGGFFGPLKWLSNGGGLGILVDQHAGDLGVWCPFFGRLASTSSLPAIIAQRSRAAAFPVGIITTGWARWRLIIAPEISLDGPTADATAQMNLGLEAIIRQSPADWFWVHNRWKTPSPAFLLQRYKRGIALPPGMTTEQLKPFRILVRSPNWLGDACMAMPSVRAIKSGRPDARLTVLCPENLGDLWRSLPEIDLVLTKRKKAPLREVARTIKSAGPFDVGILLPNSTRSALEMWLSGAVERLVGYGGHFRKKLLHQVIPRPDEKGGPPPHHAKHYQHLLQRIGGEIEPSATSRPLSPSNHRTRTKLGICPGAEYGPAKRWPVERFAEVAHQVKSKHPAVEWLIFGMNSERPLGEKISSKLNGDCRNLCGKTTLRELIDELSQCTLLLTNDTGTMHLAASLGIPTVSIFGSTEPAWTGPIGENHRVIRHHVPCSPCFLRDCPLDFRCMTSITTDEVTAAVLRTAGILPTC